MLLRSLLIDHQYSLVWSGLQDGDADFAEKLVPHNLHFLQLLEAARERVRVTGGISLAEFRRRLDAASAGQTVI